MKRRILWIICLLIVIVSLVNCFRGNNIKYPSGKDTIESFGDGTYQISSGSYESLFNEEYGSCIIQQVKKFYQTDKKVYIVGKTTQESFSDETKLERSYKMYAVIDLPTNNMMLCSIPDDLSYQEVYIYRLDEMVGNCDVALISDLSAFSDEDFQVFQEIE